MALMELASILGMVFGTGGIVLGILNYLRDKPYVRVRLACGYQITNSTEYDKNKLYGLVTVTNSGRRPIYITSVSITFAKQFKNRRLLILESIKGQKLGEGDAPATFLLDEDNLTNEYAPHWREMRAVVYDSSGKKYFSHRVKEEPSWVKHSGRDSK
jgi:hypothetical protein